MNRETGSARAVLRKLVLGTMLAASALLASACATSFTGSAHVEDGRAGCEAKCRGQGMELTGMVFMGEYSDACVCSVPGGSASNDGAKLATAGAVAGGASGVMLQMRMEEQRRQSQTAY